MHCFTLPLSYPVWFYCRFAFRMEMFLESFNLAPLVERVSMAGLSLTTHTDTFSRCNLIQCDPPPFSIFDGTNPSDSNTDQFVDEWSDND